MGGAGEWDVVSAAVVAQVAAPLPPQACFPQSHSFLLLAGGAVSATALRKISLTRVHAGVVLCGAEAAVVEACPPMGDSALPSAPTVPGVTNTHSAGGAAGPGHGGQSSAGAFAKSERWKRLLRGKRLALAFGISRYEDAVSGHASGSLPVAARDAADMAAALVSMGYDLITGGPVLDASAKEMWEAVEELRGKLEDGCTVVVYFAGHGMSGFLLPTDANTSTRRSACWRVCSAVSFLSGVAYELLMARPCAHMTAHSGQRSGSPSERTFCASCRAVGLASCVLTLTRPR